MTRRSRRRARVASALEQLEAVAPELAEAIRDEIRAARRQAAGYRSQLRQLQREQGGGDVHRWFAEQGIPRPADDKEAVGMWLDYMTGRSQ